MAESAGRFRGNKNGFVFTALPTGDFRAPKVVAYVTLDAPDSICSERTDHSVDVEAVLSDQGKVLAICVVSSNCAAHEAPAQKCARAIKLKPASLNGKPIGFYLIVPVSYKSADPAEASRR